MYDKFVAARSGSRSAGHCFSGNAASYELEIPGNWLPINNSSPPTTKDFVFSMRSSIFLLDL